MALAALNDDLLARFGGNALCPPELPPGWEEDARLADLQAPAAETFSSVYPHAPWVWKDPRTCLTLPFWRSLLGARVVCVLVYRHPLEVAQSLAARDGLSQEYGLAVWEHYVRQSLRNAAGLPVFVTSYAHLMADPLAWADGVGTFLTSQTIDLARQPPVAAIREFVRDHLYHARVERDGQEATSGLSASQARLFAKLEAMAGEHANFQPPCLSAESASLRPLLAGARTYLVASQRASIIEGDRRLAERTRWARSLDAELLTARTRITEMRRRLTMSDYR